MLQTNYMWSHGITDASIGAGESVSIQDMACRACDRSSTNIDVRQYFTANAIYELPFGKGKRFAQTGTAAAVLGGWELAGLSTARSGLPINITISRKAAAMLDGNTSSQRPNYVVGQDIYASNQSLSNWFNPAAFSKPANDTWGDLGRYAASGPGALEFDTSLQRKFQLTEKAKFELRATAYNLANHPIFSNPSGNSSHRASGGLPA